MNMFRMCRNFLVFSILHLLGKSKKYKEVVRVQIWGHVRAIYLCEECWRNLRNVYSNPLQKNKGQYKTAPHHFLLKFKKCSKMQHNGCINEIHVIVLPFELAYQKS